MRVGRKKKMCFDQSVRFDQSCKQDFGKKEPGCGLALSLTSLLHSPPTTLMAASRPAAPRDAATRAAAAALRRPGSPTSRAALDAAWRDGWLVEINALRGRCEGGGVAGDAAEVRRDSDWGWWWREAAISDGRASAPSSRACV